MINDNNNDKTSVGIVGCGLAGCMMGLVLAKRGLDVVLYEHREDFRVEKKDDEKSDGKFGLLTNSTKRSINLALSYRGICALKNIGLYKEVAKKLVPMEGRIIHSLDESVPLEKQPYGQDDEAIYSVSRTDLNKLLMDELDKCKNVTIKYGKKCTRTSKEGELIFDDGTKELHSFIVGADGCFSKVRGSLMRMSYMDYGHEYTTHGYKELSVHTKNGEFGLKKPNGLHIWPRHGFMVIALPNADKTFTCTLFAPLEGKEGLNTLSKQNKEQIEAYFLKYFPDLVKSHPNVVQDFIDNPSSPLLTVKCGPWHYKDKVIIIGDAAHAIVPFYGQGMNAAFEDCLILDELWDKHKGDRSAIFEEFSRTRKPSTDVLADLSLDNFKVMSSSTANPFFVYKKKLEKILNEKAPELWKPKYSMVSFSRIPYHKALARAKLQDKVLYGIILLILYIIYQIIF